MGRVQGVLWGGAGCCGKGARELWERCTGGCGKGAGDCGEVQDVVGRVHVGVVGRVHGGCGKGAGDCGEVQDVVGGTDLYRP